MKIKSGLRFVLVLFIITFMAPSGLNAQPDTYIPGYSPGIPVNGYVVLDNGDTLHGQVIWRFRYKENNLSGIRFVTDSGENFVFSASDIIGFGDDPLTWKKDNPVPRQIKTEDYVSIPSYKRQTLVFMHRLLDGPITVYQNRNSSVIAYTNLNLTESIEGIRFSYSPVKGLMMGDECVSASSVIRYRSRFTSYYLRKNEGELIRVDRKNFPKVFDNLFSDSQAVMDEVAKNPSLKEFKNFMILTDVYNRLMREN
jgi:hypothetical protein